MEKLTWTCAVALALVLCQMPAYGHGLLRDINLTATPANSDPQGLTQLDTNLFIFTAVDAAHGRELWRTDGTSAGTALVKDIFPGPQSGAGAYFYVAGTRAFFWANDGTNGNELWITDGTAAGTHIVIDLTKPTDISYTGFPVVWNGKLIFAYQRNTESMELWRSDGTAAGTVPFTNLKASGGATYGGELVVAGDRLYFTASVITPASGAEVWTTDGTAAGTKISGEIRPGNAGSQPERLFLVGSELYFLADDGTHGKELWCIRTPGAQPQLTQDIEPGPGSWGTGGLTAFNGAGYFTADTQDANGGFYRASAGAVERIGPPASRTIAAGDRLYFFSGNGAAIQLWMSDGSAGGTHEVAALNGPVNNELIDAIAIGTRVLFVDGSSSTGIRLWTSDGTAQGTQIIDLSSPPLSTAITYGTFAAGDGSIYFASFTTPPLGQGYESLWRSDGTAAGTVEILSHTDIALPSFGVKQEGGHLFIADNDATVGRELFVSDGTVGSLTLVKDIATGQTTGNAQVRPGIVVGDHYFFSAFDGNMWTSWRTDGTPAGTVPFAGLNAASNMTAFGGQLLMTGIGPGEDVFRLWISDGTTAGTHKVSDTQVTGECSQTFPVVNGAIFFNGAILDAGGGLTGNQIFVSDGTATGTAQLIPTGDPRQTLELCRWAIYGGELYFVGPGATNGPTAIWKTDGTAAGTVIAIDLSADDISFIDRFTASNGVLYFAGYTHAGTPHLWRSDGTTAGTLVLADLPSVSNVTAFGAFSLVLGDCGGGVLRCKLYKTDGTQAGTALLSDNRLFSVPDLGFSQPIVNGRAYYLGSNSQLNDSNVGLYSTDGSGVVLDISQPLPNQQIQPQIAFGNRLIGTAQHGTVFNNYVLWSSDGTAAGTSRIAHFNAGRGIMQPDNFVNPIAGLQGIGTTLVFNADDGIHGDEMWAIHDGEPSANDDEFGAAASGTTTLAVLANDGDIDGNVDPTTVEIVDGPAAGLLRVNATTGEIDYTPNAGFGGADQFTYAVRDNDGKRSNVATVAVWVAMPAGPTPPEPPPSTPPPASGGSGGGGAMAPLFILLLGFALATTVARRRRSR